MNSAISPSFDSYSGHVAFNPVLKQRALYSFTVRFTARQTQGKAKQTPAITFRKERDVHI